MKTTEVVPQLGSILHPPNLQTGVRESAELWVFSSAPVDVERRATPWWLWWNILSLDAPIVAIVWAALFAVANGVRLLPTEAAALGLSVWVVYTSDRLLDGWFAGNQSNLQARHLFSSRHRSILVVSVVAAGILILWLMAGRTVAPEWRAGMKLGVILFFYMAGIHASRGRIVRFLPKEIAVGFLFALGATLPLWSRSAQFPWQSLLPWCLFALLCSLNCLSIECWENCRQGVGWRQAPHPFVRWAGPRLNYLAAALVIAVSAACLRHHIPAPPASALLAICAGALLLLFLNCFRRRFSSEALRVLADAVLLAPALVALIVLS